MTLDYLWLQKRSHLSPMKIAVIDGETGERWNYQQLYERTLYTAGMLNKLGIQKGDRVALLAQNDIIYFDLLFGCAVIGAIFVPINWRLSEEEIHFILKDCGASCLFIHRAFQEKLSIAPCRLIPLEECQLEKGKQAAFITNIPIKSCDPAAIIYTGGTTGRPKGVVLTHNNIASNAINTIISWGLHAGDITLTCLPMFHTGGLNALSTPILMAGGTVVLAQDFEPEKIIDLLKLYQCTIVLMVPTMYHMLLEHPRFQKEAFPDVKTFLSGGAPCPLEVYEAFYKKGKLFKEGYGLTEAGPNNFYIDPIEAYRKKRSVGKPMLLNQVKILNRKYEEVELNEVGEIYLQGDHVFDSYWLNQNETANVKINGWLKTGDLGRKDEDGYYYIVGRAKDMIISGGENIYPFEVEQALCQHEAVKEACVIGIPHSKWGEAVTAIVSLKRLVSEQELSIFCTQCLGKYKLPKKFIIVSELPKTAIGKIDKKNLLEAYKNSYQHINENNGKYV